MCVSICFPFFLAHQEGRSPFIFKADEESNKKGRPNIDDISDTEAASDFTIRDTLSRSCSSLEEEQEKSLAELRALAMADASGFNPEQDDTWPMDSQPVEDDAGFHSKEPAACEVVDVDGDQPDSAAAGPAGPQPDAVMALLQLVKAKISTHEQLLGVFGDSKLSVAPCFDNGISRQVDRMTIGKGNQPPNLIRKLLYRHAFKKTYGCSYMSYLTE